jgi:hypothetical protein
MKEEFYINKQMICKVYTRLIQDGGGGTTGSENQGQL